MFAHAFKIYHLGGTKGTLAATEFTKKKPTLGSRCVILFLDCVSKQEVIASVQGTMTKPEVTAESVQGKVTKPEVTASC